MTNISVEVISPATGDLASLSHFSERFEQRAPEITDCVLRVVQVFKDRLASELRRSRDHAWMTREIEVGFDFSLEAGTGVLIARAGATGTFSVRLRLQQTDKGTDKE